MSARLLPLLFVPLTACGSVLSLTGSTASTLYEPDPKAVALDHIRSAPVVPNPITGHVAKTNGSRIGGDSMAATLTDQTLDVAIRSYTDDTLCMRFHSIHTSSTDQETEFADGLENNYHLYAPEALREPEGAPSITAARVTAVAFDARVSKTEYETSGDKVVATNKYRVDQKFDVCFARVSRVLTPHSSYALVDFRYDTGEAGFRYAWRFEPAQSAAR